MVCNYENRGYLSLFLCFFFMTHTYKKKCEISGIFVKISSIKAYGNTIVHGKSNEVILFQSSMIF